MNREANLRGRPAILVVLLFLAGAFWNCPTVRGEAQVLYPADGALIFGETYEDNIYTPLDFIPGPNAVKHTGYFSDDYDDVANRIEDANLGPPPFPMFSPYRYYVGLYAVPPATESLVRGTKYYWTVDETDANGQTFPGEVWEFAIRGFEVFEPIPHNEAVDVETTVLLSWLEGYIDTQGYAVFLGTNWNDVNDAFYSSIDPPPELLATTTEPNILVTGLEFNTKYYWRVDECTARCPMPCSCTYSFKGDVWCFTTAGGEAQPEFPVDGAVIDGSEYLENIYTNLDFIPGASAVEHTGYFSDNYDDVAHRIEDANLGPPPFPDYPGAEYRYFVGLPAGVVPGDPYSDGLVRGTKYYWTVDESDAEGQMFPGEIWEFTIRDNKATFPNPSDEGVLVDTNILLSWLPGFYPAGVEAFFRHEVYFGTDFNDVNNAVSEPYNPPPEFLASTSEPNILVTGLSFKTKYYWRVDEVLRLPPPFGGGFYYKGDVWSFTTTGGEAQAEFPADGAVIDGTTYGEIIFTRLDFIPGASAVEHTGYFSDNYDDVANRIEDVNLGPPPYPDEPGYEYCYFVGMPAGYIPGDPYTESLVRGTKYYWTVDERDAEGKICAGDIWEFTILGFYAFSPAPPNEATFVETDVLLSWQPGYGAGEHDVYIGTSYEAVRDARYDFNEPKDSNGDPYVGPDEYLISRTEPNILVTDLAHGVKYYWRVDEVWYRLPPPSPGPVYYIGDVWCFMTKPPLIYVDDDAVGANNGASWENAYNNLQDALTEADSALKPVEIWVAGGIYKPDRSMADPNGSGDRTATFQLISGVTLKGGFAGFGESNPDARDIELYETILSGDLAGNDVDVNGPGELWDEPSRDENSYHVVTGSDTDANAILDGFTITGGNANGTYPDYCGGGGMYNNSGNPSVTNCTFLCNASMGWGGGMFNYHSNPTLANCTFITNGGGGMDNEISNPRLTNCTFYNNNWCAIYCNIGSLTLTNCTFTGNLGSRFGGAIFNEHSSCTLTNCILWGDMPDEIYENQAVTVITYCNIKGGWPGEGNIDADPCFVDSGGWDLRLTTDSPCIDAGDNSAPNLPSTDFDGHPRIIDGDCDDGEVVDMGAYEFNYVYFGDFDYNCEVDFADFSIIALAWLAEADDTRWDPLCNISTPADNIIDWRDLRIVCENWLAGK